MYYTTIRQDVKEAVWSFLQSNSVGNRKSGGNGNMVMQFTGLVAEAQIKIEMGMSFEDAVDFGGGSDGGTDFMVNGLRVDLKTRGSDYSKTVKPHYNTFLSKEQYDRLDAQYYIFAQVHKPTSTLCIIGASSKSEILEHPLRLKGDVIELDNGRKFDCRMDAYDVNYSRLRQIDSIEDIYKVIM